MLFDELSKRVIGCAIEVHPPGPLTFVSSRAVSGIGPFVPFVSFVVSDLYVSF